MDDMIFPILIGSLLGLFILYIIIKMAVYAGNNVKFRDEQLKRQGDILEALARKQGVEFVESDPGQ